MRKALLAGLLVLVIAFSGCSSPRDDALNLAYAFPDVQAFLEENPDAKVSTTYLTHAEVSADIDSIRENCGEQMPEDSYYYVTVTSESEELEVYTDSDATEVLCVVELATLGPNPIDYNTEIGIIPPTDLTPEEILQNSEEEFEETVCNAIPNNAVHTANSGVTVLMPTSMDDELKSNGDSILFNTTSISTNATTGERSCNGRWASSDNPNTYVLIIPIKAGLADSEGNSIASEEGGIKLTFEGQFDPLIIKSMTPITEAARPITPIQSRVFPFTANPPCPAGNTCEYGDVPTFTRTSCVVDFEHSCPEKEGYTVAGQCHYSNFVGDLADDWRVVDDLGKCKYCPTGSKGTWGVLGICGMGFNCIASGTGPNVNNPRTYFVNCSSCFGGQAGVGLSYNGPSYDVCHAYYIACSQSNCADERDNCR